MAELDPSDRKAELRQTLWRALEAEGAARFPGAKGRIPNFVGAEDAARRLAETRAWKAAGAIKCNPDSPQRKVRHLALQQGKRVYMAVPKLAEARPFLRIDPAELDPGELWKASSIKGAFAHGVPVALDEMEPIELIVTGCVAVGRDGVRLGKGGGYSDLEYAVLRQAGWVDDRTPVATTVHPVQVLERHEVPRDPQDLTLDRIVTPSEVIGVRNRPRRPAGILWNRLSEEKRRAIPVLASFRERDE